MELPYFYVPELNASIIQLDEINSKHIVTVLRMKKGEVLLLTNGKGKKAQAVIIDDHRKRCTVQVSHVEETAKPAPSISIGISLLKNSSRLEWFIEKATELGVNEILPLICHRTEKQHFRHDRMQHIVISAMLQSQQSWMPLLHEPIDFSSSLKSPSQIKLIAYCGESLKKPLTHITITGDTIILIGPEGDFSSDEFIDAIKAGYQPVTLGNTRLRTETAGIMAASLLSASRKL
jgi:16S rRNA (uracil1498-N3)-methyltransferase